MSAKTSKTTKNPSRYEKAKCGDSTQYKLSQEIVDEIIRRNVAGEIESVTCSELGISRSTYHRYARRGGNTGASIDAQTKNPKVIKDTTPTEGVVSFKSTGENADGEYVSDKQPTEQTLNGILRECGADLTTWQVKEWSYKAWSTGMKIRTKSGDDDNGKDKFVEEIKYAKQYSIYVKFKRVMPKPFQDAVEETFKRMASYAPVYKVPTVKPNKRGMLAGAYLYDVHLSKLGWHEEVGEDYDLKIAMERFKLAVDDMVIHASKNNVSEWVVPIGQDFYHVDSRHNQTFAGTPQDVDGRYEKVIQFGEQMTIRAIEQMANVAPVNVLWVPGNHDYTTSFHLARTLWAWFSKHKHVQVDASAAKRKYFRWNKTLLMMTHSDKEKINDLASIFATERPQDWADTTCREVICGHRHHPEKWQTKPVDSKFGVTIRTIHSLSGTDQWHKGAGYIGEPKAAEIHLYDPVHGYDSHKLIRARETK